MGLLAQQLQDDRRLLVGSRALLFLRLTGLGFATLLLLHPESRALLGPAKPWLSLSLLVAAASSLAQGACVLLERCSPRWLYAGLCLDTWVALQWIDGTGGLRSPFLALLLVLAGLFSLLFPRPLGLAPVLLALAWIAHGRLPGESAQLFDLLVLLSNTLLALALGYLLVFTARREEAHQAERARLQAALAVAEERSRLSREIHDGLGGMLTAALLQSELVDASLPAEGAASEQRSLLRATLGEALQELRQSLRLLRGERATHLSAREICRRFQERSRIRVSFEESGEGPPLEPERAFSLHRMLQESLSNVAKHAGAAAVQVSIRRDPTSLHLHIRDDGKGFDPKQRPAGHYGLLHLEERARLLGGELAIESAPGRGTSIHVALPLRDPPEARREKQGPGRLRAPRLPGGVHLKEAKQ